LDPLPHHEGPLSLPVTLVRSCLERSTSRLDEIFFVVRS